MFLKLRFRALSGSSCTVSSSGSGWHSADKHWWTGKGQRGGRSCWCREFRSTANLRRRVDLGQHTGPELDQNSGGHAVIECREIEIRTRGNGKKRGHSELISPGRS